MPFVFIARRCQGRAAGRRTQAAGSSYFRRSTVRNTCANAHAPICEALSADPDPPAPLRVFRFAGASPQRRTCPCLPARSHRPASRRTRLPYSVQPALPNRTCRRSEYGRSSLPHSCRPAADALIRHRPSHPSTLLRGSAAACAARSARSCPAVLPRSSVPRWLPPAC